MKRYFDDRDRAYNFWEYIQDKSGIVMYVDEGLAPFKYGIVPMVDFLESMKYGYLRIIEFGDSISNKDRNEYDRIVSSRNRVDYF